MPCSRTRRSTRTTRPAGSLSVRDPLGHTVSHFYDLQGRLDSVTYPGGIVEKHTYDADGKLIGRVERLGATFFHDDTLRYDGRGKVWMVRGPEFLRAQMYYSGLGRLVRSNELLMIDEQMNRPSREALTFDALGHRRAITDLQSGQAKTASYEAQTGRLVSSSGGLFGESFWYDVNGNTTRMGRTDAVFEERTASFYAADQRLRVVDRRTCLRYSQLEQNCDPAADPGRGKRGAFEEYRYDALGRRIWVRSRSDSTCHVSWSDCESVVERSVWDGDQILYEIRAPGGDQAGAATESNEGHVTTPWRYGRVVYTHAGGIDKPVGLVRMKYYGPSDGEAIPVLLHTNWRGTFDKGTNPSGTEITGCGDPSTCVAIAWPGKAMSLFFEAKTLYTGPPTWFGSLLKEMKDNSGQLYRRNRYYDPATGRFTQEDPIGLAGGLNVYGFAGGDPASFKDPFGLSCELPDGEPCTFVDHLISWVGQLTTAITLGAAMEVVGAAGAQAAGGSRMMPQPRVNNPVPSTFARVIPAGLPGVQRLAPVAEREAFVTDAAAIRGLTYGQIKDKLGINPSPTGYEVIEFSAAGAMNIASPINRANPLFQGRGLTVGGAPEFVVPNINIPADATRTLVRP